MKMGTEFWVGHVAAAKLETISGSAYAKRHSISVAALYYWQRKLNVAAGEREAGQARRFVAFRVADAVIAPRPAGCTLILLSGMRLEMSALPAPEWLAALGRAAQGAR